VSRSRDFSSPDVIRLNKAISTVVITHVAIAWPNWRRVSGVLSVGVSLNVCELLKLFEYRHELFTFHGQVQKSLSSDALAESGVRT